MFKTTIRKGSRPFYDDKHFPRGFGRSGTFTILESDIMQEYGHTLKALFEGQLLPENEEEIEFINAFKEVNEPANSLHRAWSKYIQATQPKSFFTLNSGSKNQTENTAPESSEEDDEAL